MKTIPWLAMVCGLILTARADDPTAWQWESAFEVGRPGMVRLELPPPVLGVSRHDLGDVRVIAPDGGETPFLLERHVRREAGTLDAGKAEISLAGRNTVIEAASQSSAVIEAVRLISPAGEFLKSVTVEGMRGGAWSVLAKDQVIFRHAGGAERLWVPVSPGAWERIRVTVNDERTKPIPFTGVRMMMAGDKPESHEQAVLVVNREEVASETHLRIDLGAANLDVDELRFEIPDAIFNRTCSVQSWIEQADGQIRKDVLASGTLYRVISEEAGASVEELAVPIRKRIASRQLVVVFRNGDSPPLSITRVRASCYPTILAFHARTAGAWRVVTGNRTVETPAYDLGPLRGVLARTDARRLVAGTPKVKADYQAPPALPGLEPAGAGIDLKAWSRRRVINQTKQGVIHLELDAAALAACRSDLGDLRLVRDGKQIPYQIQSIRHRRELKPSIKLLPTDKNRPAVSRWEITMPVEGLPAVDLSATSPAPLFSRRFVATVARRDELGNRWTEDLGAANWHKSGSADSKLVIGVRGSRLPRTLTLETDHGDNPPIEVQDVTVSFPAPVLAAKLTGNAPVYLYYGNPKAAVPRYDLDLVRNELLAADFEAASLGDEEFLKPGRETRDFDSGSPWLWVALGGVVAVLLFIVARLLPKPAAG